MLEELIDEKNRETGGLLAIDGRRLMGAHNNQIKVGINVGVGFGEETQPGRNVLGGIVNSYRPANCRGIKKKNLAWPQMAPDRSTKHNNQPKAHQLKEGDGGGELRPARGVWGKRKSIVWGQ